MTLLRLCSCLVLGALAVAGCGRDEAREGTQPAPGTNTFEQGVFDDLPRFPRSEPLGPRTEEAGTVSQSFRAEGVTPEGVLDYYETALEGWEPVPEAARTAAPFRQRWARDDWTLVVSASEAPALPDQTPTASGPVATQYSLVLSPA